MDLKLQGRNGLVIGGSRGIGRAAPGKAMRLRVGGALMLLLSFLLLGNRVAAQSPVDSVRALDSAWARAYATHDTTLALALFADDLVVTSANGSLKSRRDELGDIRPQQGLRMHHFRTSEVTVRVYGRSAVVTGLANWRFTFNERDSEVSRRYTAVFVAGGPLGWRMVALHMGRAP